MAIEKNDKFIQKIGFERLILNILEKDNPYLIRNLKAKRPDINEQIFDGYCRGELNLSSFHIDPIIAMHIYIEIVSFSPYKNEFEKKIEIFKRFNEPQSAFVFFVANTVPERTKAFFSKYENFNFHFIYLDMLKQNKDVKSFLNSFDDYILDKDNLLLDDYYRKFYGENARISFALGAGCSIDSNISNWNTLTEALGYELLLNVLKINDSEYKKMKIAVELNKTIFKCYEKNSALDAIQAAFKFTWDRVFRLF